MMETLTVDERTENGTTASSKEETKKKKQEKVRDVVEQFTEDTSIHGVKNAFSCSRSRSRIYRVVWVILVLTAVGSLVKILFDLFSSYAKYPVQTVIKVTPTDQLDFPAVTICNVNGMEMSKLRAQDTAMNNVSAALIALSLLNSIFKGQINDSFQSLEQRIPSELLDRTYQDISRQAFANLNDTLISCFWDGHEETCADMFQPVDLETRRCFQFNADAREQRKMSRMSGHTSGLEVLMNVRQEEYVFNRILSAGAQIILHEPGEMPDIKSKGFLAAPGFSVMGRTTMKKYHYLSSPFKAFGKEYCIKEEVKVPNLHPNSHITSYTRALCLAMCMDHMTQASCGCRLANVSYVYDQSLPLCTLRDVYTCYFLSNASLREEECECPRPCDNTEYAVSISTAYFPSDVALDILHQLEKVNKEVVRKNVIDLKIFYDDLVTYEISHAPEYTVSSILGTLGGQMGLFIGASLLSLAEVMHLLLTLCYRAARAVCCKRLKCPVKPKGNL